MPIVEPGLFIMPMLHGCLNILIALFICVVSPLCVNSSKKCGKVDIIYPFHLDPTDEKWTGHGDLRDYELVCGSNSTTFISLGHQQYEVLSLNAEEIRINPLPSATSCSRKDHLLYFNFSTTPYRISPCNMLQLYGCNTTCHLNCSIPLPQPYSAWSTTCMKLTQAPCCESLQSPSFYNQTEFHDFTRGSQTLESYSTYFQCSRFISWAYTSPDATLSFHADFGLKLEWYVRGNCSCSSNASCRRRQGASGLHTCQCDEHYIGDGYVNGSGCNPARKLDVKVRSPTLNAILTSGVIAAAAILGAALVVGAVLFRKNRERFPAVRGWIGAGGKGAVNGINGLEMLLSGMEMFAYKQLNKATKGFAGSEKLGNGACGAVYAAKLEDGRRVAVKRLHHYNSDVGYQQTMNELSVLCTVKHRNLVKLIGCCMEGLQEPLLVFEYVSNGTLAEHLQRERGDGLDWLTRLTIAAETADALAYLHAMDPPILHRDVKSRNILLDHDFNTKVADFGLSRMGPSPSCDQQAAASSLISTIPQGTPGYLDPDYHQNFHLSDKSDVYSFGVVLIEIITALEPVDFAREKKEVNLAALAVAKIGAGSLDDIIDKSLQVHKRPSVKAMVQRVAELAFRCLAYDKDARPSMTEVLEELLLIRGLATSPLAEYMVEDHSASSIWLDAQSSLQHDSSFSLSSSDVDQLLPAKPQPMSQPVAASNDGLPDDG